MAVIGIMDNRRLQIQLDAGMIEGKQKTITRNYNNLKATATDEQIYSLGQQIAGLQSKSVLRFIANDITTLTEE